MNVKIFLFVLIAFLVLIQYSATESFAQSISISTEKSSYGKGETVRVFGTMTGAQNFPVAVEIKDASGKTILIRTAQSDSQGKFDLSFNAPSDAAVGSLQIIATANVAGQTITQKIFVSLSEEPASTGGGGCLIATAAFGSEIAPQIQTLREIRDNMVLNTASGISFMTAFNEFYYSFSPTVADWERENSVFKEAVKLVITPMIATLSILNYVDIDSEESMLAYGIGIIGINIGIYFVGPAVGILAIRKCRNGVAVGTFEKNNSK